MVRAFATSIAPVRERTVPTRAPAAPVEDHAALVTSAHSVFGNAAMGAVLRGEAVDGPEAVLHAALAFNAAGISVGPDIGNALGNSAMGELVSRSARSSAARDPADAVARAGRAVGQPLPNPLRAEMEARFGARFDDVRVHTDGAAANAADAVSAHAYTVGNHIWFGRGELRDDAAGKELLAHELTHVLQNREGAPAGGELVDGVRVSSPGDAREREAVTTAREVMTGPLEDVPEAIATRLEHTFAGEDSALHAGAFAFGAQALFGVSRAERNEDQDRHGESGALTAEQEALLEQVQARLGSIKRVAPKPAGRARSRGPARSTG